MLEKTLLHKALGLIKVGGVEVTYWDGDTRRYGPDKPWVHLTLRHRRVVRALARNISLGFGEGYMSGDIEVDGDIAQIPRLATANGRAMKKLAALRPLTIRRLNRNRRSRQAHQIQHHYDLGNDFYRLWLDESMTYSCAYFKTPDDTLEAAQSQKVDHILRKLQLKPGMTLLDIGSGWGQLLIRAVQDYGVTGHGITLSKEQFEHATKRTKELGLSDRLTFELINYQDLAERGELYDRIVSVGMFEHVGRGNHWDYFRSVDKMLKNDGLSVLHSITNQTAEASDPWIDRYIFPGGYLPSVDETTAFAPRVDWRLIDYENLRLHYAMTLHEWRNRFETNRDAVIKQYGEKFYRMWRLYLAGSESGFRWGDLGLSQFVFSKGVNNTLPLTREFLYSGATQKRPTSGGSQER